MELNLDSDVPALIAKTGHYPLHHGGVGAIRSLGRAGVRVFAITEDRHVPAAHSRWLSGMYVWPNDGLSSEALLDGFIEIAQHIGDRPVVIPTDDRTAIFLAEHAHSLLPFCRIPDQAPEVARAVASKLGLARTCAEFGVPTPRIALPADRSEAVSFCAEVGFPVVAKATEPWKLVGTGLASTSILRNGTELNSLWDRLRGRDVGCTGILLQEFISDGEDWIVHGYCNENSEALAAYSGVKIRSFPAFAGMTSLARVRHNQCLLDQAQALFKELGYRGIMDMDWRLDRRDGLYKLLDFNPRVGAQFRLFVDEHDVDVVRAQHLDLTGRQVPSGHPVDGRAFIVEHMDLIAGLGKYRQAGLAPRDWYRSIRDVDEAGWWSTDDMLPAEVFAARMVGRLTARAGRRLWRREGSSAAASLVRPKPRFYPGRRESRVKSLLRARGPERSAS